MLNSPRVLFRHKMERKKIIKYIIFFGYIFFMIITGFLFNVSLDNIFVFVVAFLVGAFFGGDLVWN
jgi:hypothetical protein